MRIASRMLAWRPLVCLPAPTTAQAANPTWPTRLTCPAFVPTPCLQVAVSDLSATLLSGAYDISTGELRATVHRAAGVQQLGGTLMALPFLEMPHLRLRCVLRVAFIGPLVLRDEWDRNPGSGSYSWDGTSACCMLHVCAP